VLPLPERGQYMCEQESGAIVDGVSRIARVGGRQRVQVQRSQVRLKVPTLSSDYSRRLPVPAAKSGEALRTNCMQRDQLDT
jgi:hypothetical protein